MGNNPSSTKRMLINITLVVKWVFAIAGKGITTVSIGSDYFLFFFPSFFLLT